MFKNQRKQLSWGQSLSAFSMLCGLLASWQCLKEEEEEDKGGHQGCSETRTKCEGPGPWQNRYSPCVMAETRGQEAGQICFHVWVILEISYSLWAVNLWMAAAARWMTRKRNITRSTLKMEESIKTGCHEYLSICWHVDGLFFVCRCFFPSVNDTCTLWLGSAKLYVCWLVQQSKGWEYVSKAQQCIEIVWHVRVVGTV